MSNANERKSPKSMLDSKKSPLGPEPRKRLMTFGLIALVIGILLGPRLYGSSTVKSISYTEFLSSAKSGGVATATVENYSGVITGTLENGTQYSVLGPDPAIAKDITMLDISLFADAVARDEWVWIECEGGEGEMLYRCTGIAAVFTRAWTADATSPAATPFPEASPNTIAHRPGGSCSTAKRS